MKKRLSLILLALLSVSSLSYASCPRLKDIHYTCASYGHWFAHGFYGISGSGDCQSKFIHPDRFLYAFWGTPEKDPSSKVGFTICAYDYQGQEIMLMDTGWNNVPMPVSGPWYPGQWRYSQGLVCQRNRGLCKFDYP